MTALANGRELCASSPAAAIRVGQLEEVLTNRFREQYEVFQDKSLDEEVDSDDLNYLNRVFRGKAMAPRVFFSFHHEDVKSFRANVVRNHGVTKETGDAGFFDASIWEDSKKHSDAAVKRLINATLENTSVTCALIGTDTWNRRWVRYEILKSCDRGNLLLGVDINGVPDKYKRTFPQGRNPFQYLGFAVSSDGNTLTYYEHNGVDWAVYQDLPTKPPNFAMKYWGRGYKLADWVPVFDWATGDGYNSFPAWVDSAK